MLISLQARRQSRILLATLLLLSGSGAQAAVPQLAVGDSHSIVLKDDGTVWTWGSDTWGQLGSNAIPTRNHLTSSSVPVPVTDLGFTTSIVASAHYYSLALKGDGTVWAWGDAGHFSSGWATTGLGEAPVQMVGISEVTAIAAGYYSTVVLKSDGTVWSWVLTDFNPTEEDIQFAPPTQAAGLAGIRAVAAGAQYGVALRSDGTVWSWGVNPFGILGSGTTTSGSDIPVRAAGLEGIIAIAAGDLHTVALKNDGTVWAWGHNSSGQLGIGTTTDSTIPVQVPGIAGVIRIAAAGGNTVALKNDGTVWVWGYNADGQLGNGTHVNSLVPIQVAGLNDVEAIAVGSRNIAALKRDGSVWEWGDNSSGQNGNGTYINSAIPTQSLINLGIANNPYNGLWWNPDESGWGMSITQHNAMIFAALYTYDQTGQPTWYVMSRCPIAVHSCTGEIYKVMGGTQPVVPWNGSGKVVSSVGTGTLTFADANNMTFNYTLEGIAGTKFITRQVFAMDSIPPAVDYSDLWWNPDESGWGVAITQEYGMVFAAWYTYDANGKAIWYVASRCPIIGNGCTGDLYQVTNGSPFTSPWNGSNRVVTGIGSMTFTFSDANNGVMAYSVNGSTGSRNITRQGF
ncbi:MAG: hypothetical protein WBO98_10745 [Candidatus Nitrotoga sp.]